MAKLTEKDIQELENMGFITYETCATKGQGLEIVKIDVGSDQSFKCYHIHNDGRIDPLWGPECKSVELAILHTLDREEKLKKAE